jgi:hypothetical protein
MRDLQAKFTAAEDKKINELQEHIKGKEQFVLTTDR